MDNTTTDSNEEKPSATVLNQIMDNQGHHSNLPNYSQMSQANFLNNLSSCGWYNYNYS